MSKKIICDATTISEVLITFEDMEARNESNVLLSQPNHALFTSSHDIIHPSSNQLSNMNKRFKRNDSDEVSISSQKLTGSISLKGSNPSGLLGKVEKSYLSSQLTDDHFSKTDEEILRNLEFASAVHNLRKFKKMV